jgi:hypothetical protein
LDDPTVPYHSTAYLKGHLAANGFDDVTLRDVNVEYVNWLLRPDTVAAMNERAALQKGTVLSHVARLSSLSPSFPWRPVYTQ